MGLYSTFGTNKEMERKGIYLQYGTNSKGEPIKFLVARQGGSNTAFNRAMEAATKPHRRMIQTDNMDEKTSQGILVKVFSQAVILGWEGVEDENNNPLPFNRENCEKLLTDLPELLKDISVQTNNFSLFRDAVMEEDEKN